MAAEDYIDFAQDPWDGDDYGDTGVKVGFCTITKETPKAVYCIFRGKTRWVPRSQIMNLSLIGVDCIHPYASLKDGPVSGNLYVSSWFYRKLL